MRIVERRPVGWLLAVVRREIREQLAHLRERLVLGVGDEVRDATSLVVHVRTAELLECHLLTGRHLDDVRAGDEHIADLAHHEDEVGHRRRVHRAAGARTDDQRELRNDAACLDVAVEDLRVPGQRDDALLDARTTGVVDADARAPGPQREIHDLGDLLGKDLAERATEDRRVVAEHEHLPAPDRSPPCDDPVATDTPVAHVEVGGAMQREHVELGEGAGVEETVDALARRELALGVLGALSGATPMHGVVAAFAQQVDLLVRATTRPVRRCAIGIDRCGRRGGIDGIARADGGNALARLSGHAVRLPGRHIGFVVTPSPPGGTRRRSRGARRRPRPRWRAHRVRCA